MIAFCFSGGGHNSNGSPMNPKGNESLFSLLSKGFAFRSLRGKIRTTRARQIQWLERQTNRIRIQMIWQ